MAGFARFLETTAPGDHVARRKRVGQVEGERILIAVGTVPFRPDNIAFRRSETIMDSDDIVDVPRLPRSIAVIGAGVIGIEYATIFSALDVAVTMIEPRESYSRFRRQGDRRRNSLTNLRDRGVAFRLGSPVEDDRKGRRPVVATLEDGRAVRSRDAALSPLAAWARPAISGLEKCGLETDNRGRIKVNPKTFQTAVPHIYAAGDVIGFPSLASTSMEQGRIAALPCLRPADAAGAGNISPMASTPCRKSRPSA